MSRGHVACPRNWDRTPAWEYDLSCNRSLLTFRTVLVQVVWRACTVCLYHMVQARVLCVYYHMVQALCFD